MATMIESATGGEGRRHCPMSWSVARPGGKKRERRGEHYQWPALKQNAQAAHFRVGCVSGRAVGAQPTRDIVVDCACTDHCHRNQ
ncbi:MULTISPECIES: hypothetical protein [Paraburkholderia]|uniref:hypothetical protein n=1 Tax=Paraburkholderia TaxID=1822464 RepID=UPI0038BC7BD9